MSKIIAFEVLDHGEDGAQYFPGCGVAFTEFRDVVTGIGDTCAAAFEDAMEQLASNDAEVSEEQEAEMRTYLRHDLNASAHASLDAHECNDSCGEWAHRVSIRYTLSED